MCPMKVHVFVDLLGKNAEVIVGMKTFYKNLWKNKIREKSSMTNV